MSRILIAYASNHGQTHKIARTIGATLRRRGHIVELADACAARPPPVEDYDAVVLGSRVQFGVHARPILEYAAQNSEVLAEIPSYFFSVSMAAADPSSADPQGYVENLLAVTHWKPLAAIAFAGALPYRTYSWPLRWVMKQISRRAGHTTDTSRDHVFTDWAQVEAFADRIAADLATQPIAPTPQPVADSGAPQIR